MDLNKVDAAEQLIEVDPNILMLEPREIFDPAVVGWVERCGQDPIACYDYEKVIDAIIQANKGIDMNYDDAAEYFSFNVMGSWSGHRTPCFLFKTGVS